MGQLTGVTLADGVGVTFEYDEGHRMEATQNALGERIEYALDAAGNQDEIFYKDGQSDIVKRINYDFDGLSRLYKAFHGFDGASYLYDTEFGHDATGRLVTVDDGLDQRTANDYDAHNRLDQVTDANNKDLFIEYDAQDRIDKVTDQRGLVTAGNRAAGAATADATAEHPGPF